MILFKKQLKNNFKPRDYQTELLLRCSSAFNRGVQSLGIQLPTGGGKTGIISEMSRIIRTKKKKILIAAHRSFLVDQIQDALLNVGHYSGRIQSGYDLNLNEPIQVGMIQSLLGYYKKKQLPKVDYVMFDEAHHCLAPMYLDPIKYYMNEGARVLGFSATWKRTRKTEGMCDVFQKLLCGPQPLELIGRGFLVPTLVYQAKSNFDSSQLDRDSFDFNQKQADQMMNTTFNNEQIIREYFDKCEGDQAVIFASSTGHSEVMCDLFNKSGVAAAHIDAKTPDHLRKDILKKYAAGTIKVLCNYDIVSEGFDLPNLSCIIQCRATISLIVHLQEIGRGMRAFPGKDRCIVLDFVGNTYRHGFAEQNRDWTLKGEPKKDEIGVEPMKTCPKCKAIIVIQIKFCPDCGHEFVIAEKKQILIELTATEFLQVADFRILEQIAKKNNHRPKWADMVYREICDGYFKGNEYWLKDYLELKGVKDDRRDKKRARAINRGN